MEEYSLNPTTTTTSNFVLFPFYAELNEMDETFNGFKQIPYLFFTADAPNLMMDSTLFGARSYVSVLNNFRSDFIDFN